MSSTAVLGFIKDINSKNIKAVNERLKKEKPNQRYSDPKAEGLVYTLLHAAVATGSHEITAALLKAGADVNAKDSKGKTPLAWLAPHTNSEPHLKIAELLLKQKDIDIQAANNSKATTLHEAAAAGNRDLVQLLLQKGASPADCSPGHSPLHAACQGCSSSQTCMPVVELLLHAAPEQLQQQDAAGFMVLMRLLQRGLWADARQLLAKGDCKLDTQAATGETALLLACSCAAPDRQLISDLLAAGASAAVQDSPARNTPLLLAVKLGGPAGLAVAQLLLQGSTSQACGAAGCAGAGPGDAALQDRCSINAANAAGETALSLAAAAALAGSAPAGKAAPAPGTSKAAEATAAAQSSADVAQRMLGLVLLGQPAVPEQLGAALLEAGLSGKLPDAITAQLVALLPAEAVARAAAAASLPQPLTFQGLLGLKLYRTAVAQLVKTSSKEPGAPQDAAGNTHLHNAVSGPEDLPDLVAALLAVGLPANAVNSNGNTALHVAARAGHVEACRALVAGGADVMRRNNKNRVPGSQLKLPEQTKAYLAEAEEAWRLAKEQKNHALWDGKIKATQTASAFGIRVT